MDRPAKFAIPLARGLFEAFGKQFPVVRIAVQFFPGEAASFLVHGNVNKLSLRL